jgi:molecular chaperone GrpE
MTDTTARADDAATEPNEAAAAAPAAAPDPVAELAREAADLKDRLLRALAEMENLRRRTEREVGDARSYAISNFARDVLAVSDNMGRALEAVGPELRAAADSGVKALVEGIELTERELAKVLDKHGVRKLEPMGGKFDPNLHQAMFEVPDETVPSGTVVQVVQAGYTIGERILRPALVGIAKGGPKAAASSSEPPANDNAGTNSAE